MARRPSESSYRYGIALVTGRSPRARSGTGLEQVQRYRIAQAHNNAVAGEAKRLLQRLGISPLLYCYYIAFSFQVDKACRAHQFKTREELVVGLVSRWQARGLDDKVMWTICDELFGVARPEIVE